MGGTSLKCHLQHHHNFITLAVRKDPFLSQKKPDLGEKKGNLSLHSLFPCIGTQRGDKDRESNFRRLMGALNRYRYL